MFPETFLNFCSECFPPAPPKFNVEAALPGACFHLRLTPWLGRGRGAPANIELGGRGGCCHAAPPSSAEERNHILLAIIACSTVVPQPCFSEAPCFILHPNIGESCTTNPRFPPARPCAACSSRTAHNDGPHIFKQSRANPRQDQTRQGKEAKQ